MMRTLVIVAGLILLSLPVSVAQESGPLLEDDSGDVDMQVAGTPVSAPDRYDHLDLTGLTWQEVPEGFDVTLSVAALPDSDTNDLTQGASYTIDFQYGGLEWQLAMERWVGLLGETGYDAYLAFLEHDEEDDYTYRNYVERYDVAVDDEAATLSVQVARDDLFDESGKPPGVGDVLTEFVVESQGVRAYLFTVDGDTPFGASASDRMPDEGAGGPVEVALGVVQEGDATLYSEAPFRISNGGATTMVYEVTGLNGGERQAFRLAVEEIPEAWEVSLPFERMVLEEGESRSFPLLVTTPSGHKHGGAEGFLLTMTGDRDDTDIGRIELGIRYTDIPQPAGHHNRLFLHSYEPYGSALGAAEDALGGLVSSRQVYFNALEEDTGDLGEPVPAYNGVIPGVTQSFYWYMDLQPFLQMGMDFDTSKEGTISIPFEYDYIAQDVTMTGSLYYYSDADDFQVGQIIETTPVSWQTGTKEIEAVIQIEDEADFIEFQPEAYLYMQIRLEGTFLGVGPFGPGAAPELVTDNAFMDLPLVEYRDPVDKFYRAVESLAFDTEYLERPVNPGETIIFETQLRNTGSDAETVLLNVTGVNDEWAHILGATEFELEAGETRDVAVSLVVPADTPDGALADLVLQAASKDDDYRRAVIDLIGLVDTEADHPDEAGDVEKLAESLKEDKKSPGFEVAAIAAGILALVLVRRRR